MSMFTCTVHVLYNSITVIKFELYRKEAGLKVLVILSESLPLLPLLSEADQGSDILQCQLTLLLFATVATGETQCKAQSSNYTTEQHPHSQFWEQQILPHTQLNCFGTPPTHTHAITHTPAEEPGLVRLGVEQIENVLFHSLLYQEPVNLGGPVCVCVCVCVHCHVYPLHSKSWVIS